MLKRFTFFVMLDGLVMTLSGFAGVAASSVSAMPSGQIVRDQLRADGGSMTTIADCL